MKQLIILTGLSGSGKSIALRVLEDAGYYCIDNLPATLLPQISHHLDAAAQNRVAISIDSRSAALESLPDAITMLQKGGIKTQVVFLESNIETLVKRFSETRRKHPLSNDCTTLPESIARERDLLAGLAELGDRVDTSNLSANELRGLMRDLFTESSSGLTLQITSFGFKNGVPLDADFVFDVRSLPNPHYEPALKALTGQDAPVQAFLQNSPDVAEMLADIQQFIEKWLPSFDADNRSYVTLAIGCTGGQHRSVYLVEQLFAHFNDSKFKVIKRHRELKNV